MKNIIQTQNAPKPLGPYSQAVQADNFLFVSGQLAVDPKIGKIVAPDITAQTRQAIENIKAILDAAGYSLNDVVQVNVYLSSLSLIGEFNLEYSKYFESNPPARAIAGVNLMPNALIEISIIAYKT